MEITILPSKAYGTIQAPPSKSMAHRFLICAGCAEGTSLVQNIDLSEDILATLRCLRAMGAETVIGETVTGKTADVTVRGICPGKEREPALLGCGECGSTLRFLIPLSLTGGQTDTFIGSRTLFTRPLGVYKKICREQGLFLKSRELP